MHLISTYDNNLFLHNHNNLFLHNDNKLFLHNDNNLFLHNDNKFELKSKRIKLKSFISSFYLSFSFLSS